MSYVRFTHAKMPMKFASVEREYEKRERLKREDVGYLQEWLEKQPHIPEMLELEIILILHACKYSVEVTKITIDNYYTMRALSPEVFGGRDPVSMKNVLNNYYAAPLPKPANDGSKVIFSKLKNTSADTYALEDYLKYMDMVLRITVYEEGTLEGIIVVYDATGFSLSHLAKVSLVVMKKFLIFLQEALPVELKQLHFFNCGMAMEKLFGLMKPFIKKDLLEVIHFQSGAVATFLAKEDMPEEYGGSEESLAVLHERMSEKILSNMDFIVMDEKKVSDESKRLQKSTRVNDLFGIEGSFKKLDID